MAVTPAYKETEVGLIPADWECTAISRVARLESGHTPSKGEPRYWGGQVPWVSLHDTDLLDGPEIDRTTYTVTQEGLDNSSARLLPKGTVVFSRTATVGKCTILSRPMATSQDFANYVCDPRLHNRFLMYLFRGMSRTWQHLMAGSIHNTVYMPVFESLKIALPPIEEQRAIAEALGDVDALLAGLDRLIAKKRDLKQAAMRQLLSGDARLPGFGGESQTLEFDEVLVRVNAKANQVPATAYRASGRFPVVDQGAAPVVGFSDDAVRLFRCPEGGVIVFGDHTCVVKYVDFDFLVGADGTQIMHAATGHSSRFLAYHLQWKGIASTGYSRHFSVLKERLFRVPQLPEQLAIAEVLTDMDAELAALEARREKTRALKQAMMQELLTGRIRLV